MSSSGYKPIKKIKIGSVSGAWGDYTGNQKKSFDVKSALPDIYDKLTVDNFIVEPTKMHLHLYTVGYVESETEYKCGPNEYDPTTGTLKIGQIYVYADKAGVGNFWAGVNQRDVYCIY